MHLLDHLKLHSPVISANGAGPEIGIRSGYPLADGSIITRIPFEIRSNKFYFERNGTSDLSDLDIRQCLGYADLVLLQSRKPSQHPSLEYNIMTSQYLDEGDDVYIYGYKGSSANRSAIHFRCEGDDTKQGVSLFRAESKTYASINGAVGAPVLNRRTNKICGIV
jgi:hypothetical protein